jgi:hypothetical protein
MYTMLRYNQAVYANSTVRRRNHRPVFLEKNLENRFLAFGFQLVDVHQLFYNPLRDRIEVLILDIQKNSA